MVRIFKPQEWVGAAPEAKSRWRVQGHRDPDGADLQIYAPAPQAGSLMLSLQAIASLNWTFE
eukprot:7513681-Pyramimonas_sp.AAC.1